MVGLNRTGQVRTSIDYQQAIDSRLQKVRRTLTEQAMQYVQNQTRLIARAAGEVARALYRGDQQLANDIGREFAGNWSASGAGGTQPYLEGRIGERAANGVAININQTHITIRSGATSGSEGAANLLEGGTTSPNAQAFINGARKRRITRSYLARSADGKLYYTKKKPKGIYNKNGRRSSLIAGPGHSYLIIGQDRTDDPNLDHALIPTYEAEAYHEMVQGDYRDGWVDSPSMPFLGANEENRSDHIIMREHGDSMVKEAMAELQQAKAAYTRKRAEASKDLAQKAIQAREADLQAAQELSAESRSKDLVTRYAMERTYDDGETDSLSTRVKNISAEVTQLRATRQAMDTHTTPRLEALRNELLQIKSRLSEVENRQAQLRQKQGVFSLSQLDVSPELAKSIQNARYRFMSPSLGLKGDLGQMQLDAVGNTRKRLTEEERVEREDALESMFTSLVLNGNMSQAVLPDSIKAHLDVLQTDERISGIGSRIRGKLQDELVAPLERERATLDNRLAVLTKQARDEEKAFTGATPTQKGQATKAISQLEKRAAAIRQALQAERDFSRAGLRRVSQRGSGQKPKTFKFTTLTTTPGVEGKPPIMPPPIPAYPVMSMVQSFIDAAIKKAITEANRKVQNAR